MRLVSVLISLEPDISEGGGCRRDMGHPSLYAGVLHTSFITSVIKDLPYWDSNVLYFSVFYVTVVVNTRTLPNSFENFDKSNEEFHSGKLNAVMHQKQSYKKEGKVSNSKMDKILAPGTEKAPVVKQQHEIYFPTHQKFLYEYNTPKDSTEITTSITIEDADYIGTAQIEELLNEIKARAIEMVADNPAVTNIIQTSVTEASFEKFTSPAYALTTFVFLNDFENIDKRTLNDSNIILISNKNDKRDVSAKSIKENAYTVAQSVEDMLQNELKSFYRKVKNKMSKEYHKDIKNAKSTLKSKENAKVPNIVTATKTLRLISRRNSRKCKNNCGDKTSKKKKKTTKSQNPGSTTPTVDDFTMLKLYEQILAKTHEDNVMKMLTKNNKRKIDAINRLSKRNPETLEDLSLKEDIKRMYGDGESIPDTDYNSDKINSSHGYSSDSNANPNITCEVTQTYKTGPVEDKMYKGLSDKIAYKDYVNGYKNYLLFEKDEAKSNFSNLIKYQAHRHHKVDEIGKFILNKIPQIPTRNKRYFFDYSVMDGQDITSKSDDSWFKKHFYKSLDNSSPHKYRTLHTVEFKDVTEAGKVLCTKDSIERPGFRFYVGPDVSTTSDNEKDTDNLNKLLQVLKNYKTTISSVQNVYSKLI